MKWTIFRTTEDRDVLVNMDLVESIHPSEATGDAVELYTHTGLHYALKVDLDTLAVFLDAGDHRPRVKGRPPVVSFSS